MALDFSTATLEARKQQKNDFEILRENNSQPGIHYPAKQLFKCRKGIKIFPDMQSQNIFLS